jgi:hypothetical protein
LQKVSPAGRARQELSASEEAVQANSIALECFAKYKARITKKEYIFSL